MLRTIVVDDEPLAIKLLSGYVSKTAFLELSGAFNSSLLALEYIETHPVDLIFLDIQMPDLTGIDLARVIGNRAKLVFVTAFERYALEGFRLDAVDYLLKPFGYDEFLKAALKARRILEQTERPEKQANEETEDFLFVKTAYKIRKVKYADILYIEGLKEYVKIFLTNEVQPLTSIMSLKSLEEKLPSRVFMRIHRSFIVNLQHIETIERSKIVFGKVQIPVSDQYKEKFQEFLNRNFL